MTAPPEKSPRERLQALLKIPERERSDEVWDEIHELEITLAPGNLQRHRLPVDGNAAPADARKPPHGKGRQRDGRPQRRKRR